MQHIASIIFTICTAQCKIVFPLLNIRSLWNCNFHCNRHSAVYNSFSYDEASGRCELGSITGADFAALPQIHPDKGVMVYIADQVLGQRVKRKRNKSAPVTITYIYLQILYCHVKNICSLAFLDVRGDDPRGRN